PVQTEPDEPAETKPDRPVHTEPDEPAETKPDRPVQAEPDEPAATKPDRPVEMEPDRPVNALDADEVSALTSSGEGSDPSELSDRPAGGARDRAAAEHKPELPPST
ncbi:MAG: hypothetical protein ABI934_02730, partial [Actinomycetota bacterium]